jgi:very-short-patch-repair endonuclease
MPAGAAISGASAAYLHGADVLERGEAVEVTVPVHARVRPKPGVLVRYAELASGDVVLRDGVPVTTPVRTAFDLARWREPDVEAVVGVDALLTRCPLTVSMIHAYGNCHSSWRRAAKLNHVLALAAPGAESPMESRLRLALVRGGLRAPVLQHQVRSDTGLFIARLDLAYPERRLGVEYDGGGHWDPTATKKDLLRQNALRAMGWSLLRFTDDDVRRHPARMLAQVRSALITA